MWLSLFNQAFRFNDLASFELAVFISLLQKVAQIVFTMCSGFTGTGNFKCCDERDVAALHALNQTFLTLIKQKDDVLDVLG